MHSEQISAFIELVEVDQRLARLSHQQEEELVKKRALEHELEQIDSAIHQAEQVVHTIQKKVHELELELQLIDRNLSKTQEKLERARSQKELDSLEHERADLEKQRILLDSQGLELLDTLELAQKEAARLHAQAPELRKEKKEAYDLLSEHIGRIATSRKSIGVRLDELREHVAKDVLKDYDAMKHRIPDPVVPVIKESCSGCFYPLSASELQMLHQGRLVICKSCYRTLYITHLEGSDGE